MFLTIYCLYYELEGYLPFAYLTGIILATYFQYRCNPMVLHYPVSLGSGTLQRYIYYVK